LEAVLTIRSEVIAAYYQSVLPGSVDLDEGFLRASCPFHFDNDGTFLVDLRNGDYRCRCGHGSMQQFEMRRVGAVETPYGWTAANEDIVAIVNKALRGLDA
jgi:hypothetical protein